MLTFGDSQTEPSSTEEEKKQQIKNTNKNSSNLRKNNTSELTRDSDGQDNQGRGQSEFKNDIASIDIVGDLNRAFNIPNAGDQENNFNGFSGQSSQNNQQQEGNSFSQQTIKMNIMSPKVKKQIQFAKFENITTEQKKIEIQSTKNGSREDISKNSNMVRREIQQQHDHSSTDLIVDEFTIGNNIFQFVMIQLIIVFDFMSSTLIYSLYFSQEIQLRMVVYAAIFFLLGIVSILLPKISKLRRYLIQLMILFRFISLIIYIECRVIEFYSTFNKVADNFIKSYVNHAIQDPNKDHSELNTNQEIVNSRYQLTQAIYVGSIVICLIYTIHKLTIHFLDSTKNSILLVLTILYVQIRFCDYSKLSLIQISLTSLMIVVVFIAWQFQNYIIFSFFKGFGTEKNVDPIQNLINASNQISPFIVSPRFGEIPTHQQNELNKDKVDNLNKQAFSIQNAARLYGLNYQNQGQDQRQEGNEQEQNLENIPNFLSPKNNSGSLQIITPRDELDSKREMYQGINMNQNTKQEQLSPSSDTDNNNTNERQDHNQNGIFFQDKIGSDTFNQQENQIDIQRNQESMRKSLNFYEEQISDNNQFEKQMEENYNNNEEYEIQDKEQPDQSLFEGDKSDIKEVTDISTTQINAHKKIQSAAQVEVQDSEEQAKWKILKQARDALQVRKKLAQQQNKMKVFNSMTQKNNIEKQLFDLEQRLEIQDMILNNISNGIIIIQKETNEIVYVNKQACQNLNCPLEQVFNTLMSLKNVNTLKDDISNFSELLQQFDHPMQLSQLSTLKGLFINHEKQREVMICVQPNALQGMNKQQVSEEMKNYSALQQNIQSIINNEQNNKNIQVNKNNQNFTLKNFLDSSSFLQIEVDQIRSQKERFMIFNINVVTWNNPYNVIHTTTLKVQYFIRKMISELSLDINDIRDYFQAVNNQSVQKLDCNGCIGKVDCMSEFLQDFATSSLLISSTFIPIKQQLNLQNLIQSVLDKMKQRTSSKQYYFTLQYDTVCPTVIYSDIKRLDRVFYNLILYFIDTNDKAYIKVKVLPSFMNNTSKKKLRIQISCSKSQQEDTSSEPNENHNLKKKNNPGVKFSLSQKKAQITNVYMLENMHYGVLLSNSIIQKIEPDDQGITFQSGPSVSFTFLLSI